MGIDGGKWIFTHRQKTETASKIPNLPLMQMIIDKYENNPECNNQNKLLPILSDQKMNIYLKEIAGICEIEKELTFHIDRHTFATTITLTNGVPIKSVSKMLGHKNLRSTQHYDKILDKKVSEDMMVLRNKMSNCNNKEIITTTIRIFTSLNEPTIYLEYIVQLRQLKSIFKITAKKAS